MKSRPLSHATTTDDSVRLQECLRDNELLLLRSNLLNHSDKALMHMVFDRGGTFEQIARLTGQSASTVSRRFQCILQKLLTRELAALLRQRNEFDSLEIRIARAYFIEGLSQRAITEKLGLTTYRVRNAIGTIRSVIYHNAIDKASEQQTSKKL